VRSPFFGICADGVLSRVVVEGRYLHRVDNNPETVCGVDRPSAPARRRKVLLLIKCLGYGGAEQLLVHMVRHRDSERFDYEVAYILENENSLVPQLEEAGVTVHSLGAASNRDLGWTRRLRTLLRQRNFDLVHSHLPYAATLGRIVVAASFTPSRRPALVYTEHSMWDKMAVALKALNRATIGLDDRLLMVSHAAKDTLPSALRRDATVVIHGIEMEPVQEARSARGTSRLEVRQEFGLRDHELLALTVANLRVEKGHDILLRAARIVTDRELPVRFIVAGRGPLEAELKAEHARLGLGDRLRFVGARFDVLRLLGAADLFVLPSRHEGLPVTLMEAAGMGVPVVAPAVGDIPTIWTDGLDALLVPPERPDALADAIARIVSDAELRGRLADGSLERAHLFEVTRCVREVEDIYEQLVPAPSGATGAR
jgi:glycosyltransferase involved in cell wall biosynthesis